MLKELFVFSCPNRKIKELNVKVRKMSVFFIFFEFNYGKNLTIKIKKKFSNIQNFSISQSAF